MSEGGICLQQGIGWICVVVSHELEARECTSSAYKWCRCTFLIRCVKRLNEVEGTLVSQSINCKEKVNCLTNKQTNKILSIQFPIVIRVLVALNGSQKSWSLFKSVSTLNINSNNNNNNRNES